MEKRWLFLMDSYEGLEKTAVNMLYGAIAGYLSYVLPIKSIYEVTREERENANIIFAGKAGANDLITQCQKQNLIQIPQKSEGYAAYVGDSVFGNDNQMVVIAGYDAAGVLYGCTDFCNQYLGDVIYKNRNMFSDKTFDDPFGRTLNPWQKSCAPAIRRRAIWTWGHVIYDYRKFFENMAK